MADKNSDVLNSLYNEDGTVKAPYADTNDTGKFATSISTETAGVGQDDINSNLGGGSNAASNMNYSWDNKAAERAEMDYKSDVLNAKNQALTNRQQIESQGGLYQEQIDMQKYSQNQTNEKTGWTGGYILDTERQMNYLKEGIKAQMYGQMELQKYGYDTSLAAARLAYDTNKYDLALQYYQQAIQNAVTEAAQTGIYKSPEVREHLDNYKIATDILNGDAEGDKEQAARLVESIHSWFKDQGISPAGIKTLERIQIESSLEKDRLAQIQSMYEIYNIDATKGYQIDIDSFGKLDENGNLIISKNDQGEMTPEIINFNQMSAEEIKTYIFSGTDGTLNETAKQQYWSRLDSLAYKTETDLKSWCISNGYYDKDGNKITDISDVDLANNYLKSSSIIDAIEKEISRFGDDAETILQLFNDWECEIVLPDGVTKKTLKLTKYNGESTADSKTALQKLEQGTTLSSEDINAILNDNIDDTSILKLVEELGSAEYSEGWLKQWAQWDAAEGNEFWSDMLNLTGFNAAENLVQDVGGAVTDLLNDLFGFNGVSFGQNSTYEDLENAINNAKNKAGLSYDTVVKLVEKLDSLSQETRDNMSDKDKKKIEALRNYINGIKAAEDTLNTLKKNASQATTIWNGFNYYDNCREDIVNTWTEYGKRVADAWEETPIMGAVEAVIGAVVGAGETVVNAVKGGLATVIGGIGWLLGFK